MKSQLIVLLGAAVLLSGCHPVGNTTDEDDEGASTDITAGTQTDGIETSPPESGKAQDISQEEGIFLPSDASQGTNPPVPPTIPRRMGSDPAGSALRYKEKADAVTQRMKEQAEETERYMQR